MDFYTYIYYDPSRGNEPFYVGKGIGNRAWGHLKRKDKHQFTNRLKSMKAQGASPVIGLYSGLDEEFAYFLEEELIAHFGRKDINTGTLLNMNDGGKGGMSGYKPTPEHIEKMRLGRLGKKRSPLTDEQKKHLSSVNKGKKRSEEARKNIAEGQKGKVGKPHSEESKRKISETMKNKNKNKVRF